MSTQAQAAGSEAALQPVTEPAPGLLGREFLTQSQLAGELGLSERTLARWHVERTGPPRVCLGRLILYRRASVLEWLATREENQSRRGRR
jgi:predicted DNA-binding transcriptional regulator AlpA